MGLSGTVFNIISDVCFRLSSPDKLNFEMGKAVLPGRGTIDRDQRLRFKNCRTIVLLYDNKKCTGTHIDIDIHRTASIPETTHK